MKAAIVGCGMIANFAHIPAYRHLDGMFEVAGVCDININAAELTAKKHGIAFYTDDFEAMLEKIKPDIVSVCVPNMFHKQYIKSALEFGAHVICEKPLAVSYSDAAECFALAKRKGLMLCAAQSMRYTPDRLAAKSLIDAGALGDIYYGEFSRIRRRGIPKWGAFHIRRLSGGGAFVDIGVHMLDALVWLMGNPKAVSVSGSTSTRLAYKNETLVSDIRESGALGGEPLSVRAYDQKEFDVDEFASGSIVFEGGRRINFKTAWAANLPDETSIILCGDKSGLRLPELDIYGAFAAYQADIRPKLPEGGVYPNEKFGGHFMLFDLIADFLNGKGELPVKPEETLNVSKLIELFYRSAAEHREIYADETSEATAPKN